jgi:hypothetical protein
VDAEVVGAAESLDKTDAAVTVETEDGEVPVEGGWLVAFGSSLVGAASGSLPRGIEGALAFSLRFSPSASRIDPGEIVPHHSSSGNKGREGATRKREGP